METECPKCGEPMEWRIFQDGDGDPSVPGCSRTWTDAELSSSNCSCEITDDEYDTLRLKVVEDAYDYVPAWADF